MWRHGRGDMIARRHSPRGPKIARPVTLPRKPKILQRAIDHQWLLAHIEDREITRPRILLCTPDDQIARLHKLMTAVRMLIDLDHTPIRHQPQRPRIQLRQIRPENHMRDLLLRVSLRLRHELILQFPGEFLPVPDPGDFVVCPEEGIRQ